MFEKYAGNCKGLICMAADSVLTFACVIYGTLKYGDVVDLRDGMLATVACVALVWAVFLIIRYLKVNGFFKCALCFAASVVWVAAMTVLSNAWNGMKLSEIFSVKGADNSRYDVIVCLCLAGVAAVLAIAGAVYKFVRKNRRIGKAERTKERYKTDRDNLDFVGRRGRRPLHKCD